MFLDHPKGFRDARVIAERDLMLTAVPSAQPLREYVEELAETTGSYVPHFDPAEAGVCARVLIVHEAPGPKANPINGGSGYVAVDNNDQSAANMWAARKQSGVTHYEATHWNTVGWYLGKPTIKPSKAQEVSGVAELVKLSARLHRLECVVATGRIASNALRDAAERGGGAGELELFVRQTAPSCQS